MSAGAIEVLSPGLLTTIQDLGRFGLAHLGISPAGAADRLSLRIANHLVGNDENAATFEMTLVGATLRFYQPCTIALAGAAIATSVVPMLEPVRVNAGFELQCGPLREGARAYLAIAGGIDVPGVLGSASTDLAAGFGGFHGRALKKGDLLRIGSEAQEPAAVDSARLKDLLRPGKTVRVTRGPQHHLFTECAFESFQASAYLVTEQSNRLGLRLSGTPLKPCIGGELLTEGVSLGAIQIPPNGQPIVLFIDQQTTGGYPKLANVIAADLHSIGQLRPRDTLRFEMISFEAAIEALREQELSLAGAFSR